MIHRPPKKNVLKIPPPPKKKKKFHDKAIQFNIQWLNLNKINGKNILQSADKQGTPSFHFHAPGSKRRYHALKQHWLCQNSSPVCFSFVPVIASDMHLEPESENRAANVDFHTAKNILIQAKLAYSMTSDLFTVVWPEGVLGPV